MKATNIVWDKDLDDEDVNLPNEVEIKGNVRPDDIADYLSDEYGWCVSSFSIDDIKLSRTFEVELSLLSDGLFNLCISHNGSSGKKYEGIAAEHVHHIFANEVNEMVDDADNAAERG